MGSLPFSDLPKPWVSTPLVESAALSKAAGCRIFLKLENLQPAASFKSRGIGNLIRRTLLTHPHPHLTHFYSSSGGNAGLACVTAAHTLGRPATVVVPLTTKPLMVAKIRNAGASDVIQIGASWAEADAYLREEALGKDKNGVYVPPFDHEDVWDGAATIVEELEEKPDALVCSVGGGGLFSGLVRGLDRKGWGDVTVLALEPKGAESLHKSLEKGELVRLEKITSICTSLGATRVGEKTFEYGQRKNVRSVVLEDREAVMGCWRLADDERLLVEPACGINVALCYDGRLKKLLPELTAESKVVIVVCGGAGVTLEMLIEWREKFGLMKRETTKDKEVPSTVATNGHD
ncbi:catabolic L-serine/threonine dehydratase [Imshaugia aleurites]|uniref:L-serine ammonia-lyase n=1 Tax=Imshaugia aleurites TaxID=172621 RepID=A0A8H3IKK2_9LECA|nr:catabolic L-serine/threonine dehydratase [Imshaugia aleurites]